MRKTVRDVNAPAFFSFLLSDFSFKICSCASKFVSLHPKSECGEIWLLATTIKNAKREGRLRTAPRYWSLKVGRTCVCSAFCFRVIWRVGQIFFFSDFRGAIETIVTKKISHLFPSKPHNLSNLKPYYNYVLSFYFRICIGRTSR